MSKLNDGLDAYQQGDYELAFSLVFPLAEAGNVTAQCHIASIYEGGLGVPIDEQEVAKWCRKAAEQEDRKGKISGIAYNNLANDLLYRYAGDTSRSSACKEILA